MREADWRDELQPLREFYEMLQQSQWWGTEQLVTWQRHHLQLLLNHARATSPFYRFRLNRVFRANGTIDWDRWTDVPILSRADLASQFDAILSRHPIEEHGPTFDAKSSGSTGHAVTTRLTRWLMDMSNASNWRAHAWARIDWSKVVVLTGGENKNRKEGDVVGVWGPPWESVAQRGRVVYSHYGTPYERRLELIRSSGASYHATSALSAEVVAERALENGTNIHLDAILARGGAVTNRLRALAREAFGAEVVESYSSKEAGAMAAPCPTAPTLHVNSESLLVEIVDKHGVPVRPGESGRVVVTPFGSTALPLIRYDQGDIAVAGGECSCGRCLPTIASVSGRERSAFSHPDGRRFLRDLPFESYPLIGAGRIQVAQVGPTDFEIRYTPRNWNTTRDEGAFVRMFRDLYYEDANLIFVCMTELPISPAGKFMSNVLEWEPNSH